jgi:hypothetical protein
MVLLRKALAGSCNLGYTWPEDGAVVEVTSEHAAELLAIPYNDFTVVEAPAKPEPVEEPAPEAEISEAPAPRPAKKATARKTAATPAVEE